jgi:seryl-tRNA synthetase
MNLRYRGQKEKSQIANRKSKIQYCHTLNNTVIASPRILIPILELYQNADGSITVPSVLRHYINGREIITKA